MEKTFTDVDGEVVSFYGTSPNKKIDKTDFSVCTSEIISLDQQCQSVESRHVEIQTDEQLIDTKTEYDEASLLEFMRRCAPKMEEELRKRNKHFGANFQHSLIDEDEVVTKKLGELMKYGKVGEIRSRHVSWSCYGNKIAINFSYIRHDTWCKHTSFILIYESDKNGEFTNEAKECIEINTCVVDLQFHPTINTVLVFASEEGKIYWHNTTETLGNNLKNSIHHECVKITQLSWVELNSSLYLVVADSEGFLNFWATSNYIKDWRLWKKFSFKSLSDVKDRGVVCFDFSINRQNFVVSLECGVLLQCSTILNTPAVTGDQSYNPVVCEFECPSLLILSVVFSKFEENIFVVSSYDKMIRIYNLHEKVPIFLIAADYFPLGLEWSHLQDNIFRTWSYSGEIRYYNYLECKLIKSFKLEHEIHSMAFKVKGMKLLFVAVDVQNNTTIWQTGLFVK